MPRLRFLRSLLFLFLAAGALPAQISVTIASTPSGTGFTVSGTGCSGGSYTTPQVLSWTAGSSCSVAFTSPQYPLTGTQLTFTGWQEGGSANPRTITAPAQATTYTANFSTVYFLTTAANPSQGGTVSGSGFYAANTSANVAATTASGYEFSSWTGVTSPNGASASVTMTGALTVTANFVPTLPAPPNTYVVTQILAGGNGTGYTGFGLNNFGQVVAGTIGQNAAPSRAILWTPSTVNGTTGTATDLGNLPVNGTPSVQPTAINDQGQVVGTIAISPGASSLPFLWQPAAPNATSGNMVAFLGSPPAPGSTAAAINNFGQIIGGNTATSFLWTPSSANATTGTVNTDSRLATPSAINSFGQVAISAVGYPSTVAMLFTPSTPNSSSGTFTQIPTAASNEVNYNALAINSNGTVLMDYGGPCGLGACAEYGRLFTPSSPNATTGTTAAIPIPAGFRSLFPMGLNDNGQVLGSLDATAFLYSGGTVYGLDPLLAQTGGSGNPRAINDKGQILINVNPGGVSASVYLATPQTLAPVPMAPSPQSGSGTSQTMVFTFSDPRGWQDLGVVNVLINNFIDGRNACYLAYSVPLSTLYLVNDAGIAQGPYAGSLTLGSSGTISNSQCTVGLTSAVGSGNLLTLTVAVTFKTAFAGNKILYLAARDVAQNNSGWVPLGVWLANGVTQNTTILVDGMTRTSGSGLSPAPFTFTFSDTKGYADLGVENILINSALDGRHACYLAYARQINWLYIVNDAGNGLLPGASLGASGSVNNSQCTVSWGNNAATGSGNGLSLALNIGFYQGFGPNVVFYLAARDVNEGNNTGWLASGTWVAQ
jgi:hypothetical protein